MRFTLIILLFSIAFISCKKKEDRACWKSWGEEEERIIPLEEFFGLNVFEHLEVTIVEDTANFLILRGGENMLNQIEIKIKDGELLLKNNNKCNFLRGFKKKIKIELHEKGMYNIKFQGSEPLTSLNVLNINYFTLFIRDGAGDVNLNLNSIEIDANIEHGFGNFTLKGKTNFIDYNLRSNSYCEARELLVMDSIRLFTNSSSDMHINVDGAEIRGEIEGNGDVYLKGIPTFVDIVDKEKGKGKIIYE